MKYQPAMSRLIYDLANRPGVGHRQRRVRMSCLLLFCVVAVSIAKADAEEIAIVLPEFASESVCRVFAGEALLGEQPGRSLRLTCPARGEVLRCSGRGIEPIDLPLARVCESRDVPVLAASEVAIQVDQPVSITTEWLTITATGEVSLVARRSAVAERGVSIALANRSDRLIRFYRPGASPVTVHSSELQTSRPWRLPEPKPGGELFALIGAAAVLPTQFRLTGTIGLEIDRAERVRISVQGIRSGRYDLVPVYEGGLTGHKSIVEIEPEQTAVVVFWPENVGAARVVGDESACSTAEALVVSQVKQIGDPEFRGATSEEIIETSDVAACRWLIAGLRKGTYEASLRIDQGSGGRQIFDVSPQAVADVRLMAPTVVVSGQVSYNGKPLGRAAIAFVSDRARGGAASTIADDVGSYTIRLDAPGNYTVTLKDGAFLPVVKRERLDEGTNRLDWSIAGAAVTVRVHDRGGTDGTVIVLTGVDVNRSMSSAPLRDNETQRQWFGLPPGTYDVSANQGQLVSRTKRIALGKDSDVTVDLELIQNTSTLTVRDEIGDVVQGLRFRGVRSPPEVGLGVYSLEGVVPGSQIRIQAGDLVPVCVVAPGPGDRAEVTLHMGRPVVLQFSNSNGPVTAQGSLLDVEGSNCPVLLADFQFAQLQAAKNALGRLVIKNFPTTDGLTFLIGRRRHVVSAAEDGVVVIGP